MQTEIRSLIITLRKNKVFEELEIWTPEKHTDPALIGIINNKAYLLARWGEEKLLTFDQIKRGLRARSSVGLTSILGVWLGAFFSVAAAFTEYKLYKWLGLSLEKDDISNLIIISLPLLLIASVAVGGVFTLIRCKRIKKKFAYAF